MKLSLSLRSVALVALVASLWLPPGQAHAEPGARSSFLVLYHPGPAWAPGKHIRDQPPKEHGRYLLQLFERGEMKLAGPFEDDTGAAILLEAADLAAATALIAADPAVKAKIFTFEIHAWGLVPWERYVKKK